MGREATKPEVGGEEESREEKNDFFMEIILEEPSKSAWLFNLKERENVMLCGPHR